MLMVVTSGNLDGGMVSTLVLVWNAKDVGSIPTLGAIFPIFLTTTTGLFGMTESVNALHN